MMKTEQHKTRLLLLQGKNWVKCIYMCVYIHIYEMTMNNKTMISAIGDQETKMLLWVVRGFLKKEKLEIK